jgi:rhodanese-related sulfurtransferase
METIIKKKTYLVMNALSKESFDKKHIPNSILCHNESLEGLTKQKKDGIIKQLIKKNLSGFPKIKEFIDSTDSIKDVPIIVYCAHDECEASAKLTSHLYDCGYYNVMEYPGGLKEWFSETDDKKLFDDAPSDEEVIDEVPISPETKLPDDEEIMVYDGVEYIHKLDETNDGEEDILTKEDMEHVGIYDGKNIVWNTNKDYKDHLERKGKKGDKIKEEEEEEEDEEGVGDEDDEDEEGADEEGVGDEDDDDEEGADEEGVGDEDEGDDDDDDDDDDDGDTGKLHKNKEYLQSKTIREIRELLDKLGKNTIKGSKKKLIDCLMNCNEEEMKGGGADDTIIYGGGPQTRINQQFRGWGFTF